MTYVQPRVPLEQETQVSWQHSLAAALVLVGGSGRHALPTLDLFNLAQA